MIFQTDFFFDWFFPCFSFQKKVLLQANISNLLSLKNRFHFVSFFYFYFLFFSPKQWPLEKKEKFILSFKYIFWKRKRLFFYDFEMYKKYNIKKKKGFFYKLEKHHFHRQCLKKKLLWKNRILLFRLFLTVFCFK